MSRARTQDALMALGWIVLALCSLGAPALAELSITWHTVDAGGQTFGVGATYALCGTCGQPDAGIIGAGTYQLSGGFWRGGQPVSSVEQPTEGELEMPGVPAIFRVIAGIQNPFMTETLIRLDLPSARPVDVRVFDHAGRLVNRLHEGWLPAGQHVLSWNGAIGDGRRARSGIYLLQVRAGDHVTRKRVVYFR